MFSISKLRSKLSIPSRIREERVIITFLLVVVALWSLRNDYAVSDTWWDLRGGKDVWAGHSVWHDSYSYTIKGAYWPNHEWLWQALFYAAYWVGGGSLVIPFILNTVIMLLALYLSLPTQKVKDFAQARLRFSSLLVLIPILIAFLYFAQSLRPSPFTFLLCALVLRYIRREKFWALPVVMVIWANSHASFFVGGILIFCAFLTSLVFYHKDRTPENRLRARRLLITGTVSLAVTFLNPEGYRAWGYVIASTNKAGGKIIEWQSIMSYPAYFQYMVVTIFILFTLCVLRWKLILEWSSAVSLLPAVLLLALSFSSLRSVPYLIIVLLPPLFLLLGATRWRYAELKKERRLSTIFLIPLILVFLVGGASSLSSSLKGSSEPISKADLAAYNSCKGPEYNDYWSGGYLIWFNQSHKVFLDNRFDPYDANPAVQNTLTLADDPSWPSTFAHYHIACAWMSYYAPPEDFYVLKKEGWTKVYSDKFRGWSMYKPPADFYTRHK